MPYVDSLDNVMDAKLAIYRLNYYSRGFLLNTKVNKTMNGKA